MPEDPEKEEEKFDFNAEGEGLGYISLAQARMLAMQTARETPGEYGRRFRNVGMAFEVAESNEDEDYYNITLSFRPQGKFAGTPGQEQFFIGKEGAIAHRQVLSLPFEIRSPRSLTIPVLIGLLVIGAAAVAGVVLVGDDLSGLGKDSIPVAGDSSTNTPSPTPNPNTSGAAAGVTIPRTPTSSDIPTQIPKQPPTPSSYALNINGTGATKSRATVCQGIAMLKIAHGAVMFSPLPGSEDQYPTNTIVHLEAYPNEAGSQVTWNGVESYIGNRASALIDEATFINLTMVPSSPTKTPPPSREEPADTDGELRSISQPCFVAGESNTVTAVFQNTGSVETHFRISVAAMPPGWKTVNQCQRIRDGVCEFLNVSPGDSVPVKFTIQANNPGIGTVTLRLLAAHTCGLFGCRWDVEVDRRSQNLSVFPPLLK